MKTGFFRNSGVEKKNRAISIVNNVDPIVVEIIKEFKPGPISETHMVPGGAGGMTKLGGVEDMVLRQKEIMS